MRILASPLAYYRIGIVVPKYRWTAVRRNRLKRQLRELVRTRLIAPLRSTAGTRADVVIRARREAYEAPFAALGGEIDATGARLMRHDVAGASAPDTSAPESA